MNRIYIFAIASAALLAVSCQKEKELHPVGSQIIFTAATEYKNGDETRTIYSGEYTGTATNYERIDWVDTDQVKILYYHGSDESRNYDIVDESEGVADETDSQNVTYDDRKGTARIQVASGSSALEWADGETHKFFGLYPSQSNISGVTLGLASAESDGNRIGQVTGLKIPNRQTVTYNSDQGKYLPDMNKAYMVAYASPSSGSTVNLPFTPVVTAVEFMIHLPQGAYSYQVSKVELKSSTALAGTYSVDITGYDDNNKVVQWTPRNITGDSGNSNVIVEFVNENGTSTTPAIAPSVTAPATQTYLDFTMFVLPQTIEDPELLIKYNDNNNPLNQTIKKITLTDLTLSPGKKYKVYNTQAGHDTFTYEVSPITSQTITGHDDASFTTINVSSLKRSRANPNYTENVNWKVQYYNTTQSDWYDVDDANYPFSGYTVNGGYTLTENHSNNTLGVKLSSVNRSTRVVADSENITPFDAATELLKARTPKGTENDPYDLSTHDLNGNTIGQTAANCYVVTAPGWYKFPLIYGNARVLGVDNSEAYHPTTDSSWDSGTTVGSDDDAQNYYLTDFYNAAGDVIDDPYILTDLGNLWGLSATVGGTTAGSSPSVHKDSNHGMDPGIITGHTLVGSGASAYVKFHVSENNIKPGNTRLLLEGSAVNTQNHGLGIGELGPILWSWHIWVTDKDLTPQNGVMPYNLGWVDKDEVITGSVSKYTDRSLQLRIVQLEGTPLSTTFTLTQNGDIARVNYVSPTQGTSSLFQWGRKDPYSPTQLTVPLTVFSDDGESTGYPTNYWYWRGIRFPEVMLASQKSRTWMDGKAIPLYESTQTQEFDHNDYYIKSTSQKTGPFTDTQKARLEAVTAFSSGVSFTSQTVVDSYTLAAGTYGPIADDNSGNINTIRGIIDTSEEAMKKRVTYANYTVHFSPEVHDYMLGVGLPSQYWTAYIAFWDIVEGTELTTQNLTDLSNLCSVYSSYNTLYGHQYNDYTYFWSYCLQNVFRWTISATSVTPEQRTTLISYGFPSNAFTVSTSHREWNLTPRNGYPSGPYTAPVKNDLIATTVFSASDFTETPVYNTITTLSYTSDSDRNAGSILYNLWSAYRYNENSPDAPSSGDKMKTVYDPCPPGFTVPTRETYLGSNSLSNKSSSNLFSGGGEGTDYPYTGARLNTHAGVTGESPDNVSISNASSIGYYWTDHPCNMSYSSGDKTDITSYLYYQDAYILKNTSSSSTTVEHISRATAAAVRPMVDPRAQSAAGITSQGNVQGNSIEAITNGNSLY